MNGNADGRARGMARKSLLAAGLPALAALSLAAIDDASAAEAANSAYIDRLQYNLSTLLSVSLAPSSQPAPGPRTEKRDGVVICTKNPQRANLNVTENALLNPSGGVVYPGALVRMDRRLAEGLPTPITLRRAPLRIAVDLPGLGANSTKLVENPTNLTVDAAVNELVRNWHARGAKGGYKPGIRAFYESKTAYTSEQIGVQLGFSGQWSSTAASASVDLKRTTEQTVVMKSFKQVYFTASIEEPPSAGSVFHDSVTLNAGNMPASGPPGLVRSVDYGRIIIVMMVTNKAQTRIDAEAALEYTTGAAKVDAKAKATYDNIVNNSTFKVLALGGGAAGAVDLFSGDPKKIVDVIRNGIAFSPQNPAYPIAYKVADLKTREIARMSVTTDYIETNCQEYPNGWVELRHNGGYVAKFAVSYKSHNAQGQAVTTSWDSGQKTAGWSEKRYFPGDAWDIRITGTVATGLVWDPWKDAMNLRLPAVPNKCYKIYGTTLDRKYGEC